MFKILTVMLFSVMSLFAHRTITVEHVTCSQELNYMQLKICYNYNTKIANYVTYYATAEQVAKSNKRTSFREDKNIPKKYRATLDDYYKKENIDRFHLCPSFIADYSKKQLRYAFYLSNVVPGDSRVNRYRWILAEHQEKNFYLNHNSSISITGVILTKQGTNRVIGEHNITVPEYFYKCFFDESNVLDYQCYVMANDYNSSKDNDSETYKVTLKQLEKFGIKIKIK